MMVETMTPLYWLGSARQELTNVPDSIREIYCYGLCRMQFGRKFRRAKTVPGYIDTGVLEVIEDNRGDVHRALYTLRCASAVYVLLAYEKPLMPRRPIPRPDRDLIRSLVNVAASAEGTCDMSGIDRLAKITITLSRGNVYADLGFRRADELLVKATLTHEIEEILQRRHLRLIQAAARGGMMPAELSGVLRGRFRGTSEAKLSRFVDRIDRDIDDDAAPAGPGIGDNLTTVPT
jgi:phage-related protein/predicted XRE-type DNA-binding protein